MAAQNSNPSQLPTPKMFFRKHDFGSGNYETLMVSYVPERVFEGVPYPNILRCTMFGTLRPQDDFSASDIEAGQMLLDAHFSKHFSDHQCNEDCIGWPEVDDTPPDEPPVSHMIQ